MTKQPNLMFSVEGEIILVHSGGELEQIFPTDFLVDTELYPAIRNLLTAYNKCRATKTRAHNTLNEILQRPSTKLMVARYFRQNKKREKKARCLDASDQGSASDHAASSLNHTEALTVDHNTNKEFTARLFLKNRLVTITGTSMQIVQDDINNLLPGGKINYHEKGNTTLLYHSDHSRGSEPFGWITQAEVPTLLSLSNMPNTRETAGATK